MYYVLYKQPFLDHLQNCYKNIITINTAPEGPLSAITKRVQFPLLSNFQRYNTREKCGYAIHCICNPQQFLSVDEIPELFSFLSSNSYEIETNVTKLMTKGNVNYTNTNGGEILCFIRYIKL
jgi:hypothetical protein